MKNFMEESDLLPVLKSTKTVRVTTDYGRFDSLTPYANGMLLKRLQKAGKISQRKISAGVYEVSLEK